MGNVYHTKEEMIDCVNAFYEGMVHSEVRNEANTQTIRRAENYACPRTATLLFIFDEYVAFF